MRFFNEYNQLILLSRPIDNPPSSRRQSFLNTGMIDNSNVKRLAYTDIVRQHGSARIRSDAAHRIIETLDRFLASLRLMMMRRLRQIFRRIMRRIEREGLRAGEPQAHSLFVGHDRPLRGVSGAVLLRHDIRLEHFIRGPETAPFLHTAALADAAFVGSVSVINGEPRSRA
jgi:hypothetical protein